MGAAESGVIQHPGFSPPSFLAPPVPPLLLLEHQILHIQPGACCVSGGGVASFLSGSQSSHEAEEQEEVAEMEMVVHSFLHPFFTESRQASPRSWDRGGEILASVPSELTAIGS